MEPSLASSSSLVDSAASNSPFADVKRDSRTDLAVSASVALVSEDARLSRRTVDSSLLAVREVS